MRSRRLLLPVVGVVGLMAGFLVACTRSATRATELPRGEPPQPAPKRLNVAEFGAHLADDDHDDTAAVNAAIKAAGDRTTLYFPAGVYNVRWVDSIRSRRS